MKKLLTVVLAAGSFYSQAQKMAKPDAYAKTITAADAKKHLYIIASPEMEGRETGTEGQRKAAAYIENYFKSIGLQPGNGNNYQQYYSIYQDTLLGASMEVNGNPFGLDKDFTPGNTNLQATLRFSEAVVLSSNALDSLKTADLAGRLVLIAGTANQVFYAQLLKKSPAAILNVSTSFPKTTPSNRKGRQTINVFRKTIAPPVFDISAAVAKSITGTAYDAVKEGGGLQVVKADVLLDVRKASTAVQASDVLGLLPGTDLKDEYVIISAHYDHLGKRNGVLYPGADDDGSGTVGILELAEAFAKAKADGKGPRRSILFLANSGEEKGLWGSEYYTDHPVYPLDKTTVDLNIDMIGRIDPDRKAGDSTNYVYVVGDDKISTDLKMISEEQNKKYIKMELDYKYNDPNDKERIYYRSDHYSFARYGVPIIFYYDGMLRPDYHRPTDTPDKINYDLLSKRARLVFYTGWEMANRDAMLKRDIPLGKSPF